jgi:broad specificity phosphatase PhoE
MRSLWIARHGNRQDFVDPDWHGTADRPHDPGLSPDGVEQARALGRRIASLSVDGIVASPFLRAVQTAQQVADLATHTVRLDPGLGEWHNADWFETSPDPLPADTLAERFERVVPDHEPCLPPSFPVPKADAFDRIGRTAQCLTERPPTPRCCSWAKASPCRACCTVFWATCRIPAARWRASPTSCKKERTGAS